MMIPNDVLDVWRNAVSDIRRTESNFEIIDKAQYWIDTMPVVPEVDWVKAPSLATHHAYCADGQGVWLRHSQNMHINAMSDKWTGYIWSDSSGYELPLGLDWRLTLTARPGVDE